MNVTKVSAIQLQPNNVIISMNVVKAYTFVTSMPIALIHQVHTHVHVLLGSMVMVLIVLI